MEAKRGRRVGIACPACQFTEQDGGLPQPELRFEAKDTLLRKLLIEPKGVLLRKLLTEAKDTAAGRSDKSRWRIDRA